MTTATDGPADIANGGAGNLGAIANLIQYFGGTNQAGTTNASTRGATGPLESLFSTSMDPNNLLNLVQNLFAQGAAQVPGLTSQFANATGTRVDNNTMLGQSLAGLNQTLAQSIAQAILQQQSQVALPAAQQIAKSNTTASEGTKKSTEPGDNAGEKLFGTLLGGVLLNKLGGGKTPAGNTPPATPAVGGNVGEPQPDSNSVFPTSYDTSGAPGGAAPAGSGVGFNLDLSNAGIVQGFGDAAQLNPEVPYDELAGSEVAPIAEELPYDAIADGGGADWFFADGGLVTRKGTGKSPARANRNRIIDVDTGKSGFKNGGRIGRSGYADGGEVDQQLRGVPNFGPRTLPQMTQAQSFRLSPEGDPEGTRAITRNPLPAGVGRNRNVVTPMGNVDEGISDVGALDLSMEPGNTATGPVDVGLSMGQMASLGMIGLSATNPATFAAMAFPAMVTSTITKGIVSALTGAFGTPADSDPGGRDAMAGIAGPGMLGVATGQDDPAGFTTAALDLESAVPGEHGAVDDAGVAVAGDDDDDFAGGDEADAGDEGEAAGAGEGDGAGEGGAGGGDGEKDGGLQAARSKSQKGIDRIPIHVTEGEYVLPVDVTNFIGVDKLDALIDAIHAPVN